MHQETDMELETQKLNPADAVHCILYVLSPQKSNLVEMSRGMKSMRKILKDKNSEGNIWVFLLLNRLNFYTCAFQSIIYVIVNTFLLYQIMLEYINFIYINFR